MWHITFQTKQIYLEIFNDAIESVCDAVAWVEIEDPTCDWDSENWRIEGYAQEKPDLMRVEVALRLLAKQAGIEFEPHTDSKQPTLTCDQLPETNWLADMWEKFPPQTVGPFFIHSSFFKGDTPADTIPLVLDAATAFGSGEHGTTAGCLLALHDITHKDGFTWKQGCDLGCGSGILAIGACKLQHTPFLAIDRDEEAVRVSQSNAVLNNVHDLITIKQGDCIAPSAGLFDVIVANILAAPLIQLAENIYSHTHNNGYIILSGLLDWQQDDVQAAYTSLGLDLVRTYNRDRWITLVFLRQ